MLQDEDGDIFPERKLVVHLGAQMTGIAPFHRLLRENADALAPRMVVCLPDEDLPLRPLARAIAAFCQDPDGEQREYHIREMIWLLRNSIPEDDRPVLISHENLCGTMPGDKEQQLYPQLRKIVTQLDKHLGKLGQVHFVLTTARIRDWLPRVWAQGVISSGYAMTEEQFMADLSDLPNWPGLVRRLTRQLGEDRLHHFKQEQDPDPQRPGSRILALTGMAPQDIAQLMPVDGDPRRLPRSAAIEFMRQVNDLQLNPYPRGQLANLVARAQYLFTADDVTGGAPPSGTL